MNLVRRMQLGTMALPSSAQFLDRVIDITIVVFLVCSVVSITAAQTAMLTALAAWLGKLVGASRWRHFTWHRSSPP